MGDGPDAKNIIAPIRKVVDGEPAISYLPLMMPKWGMLEGERELYPRPRPLKSADVPEVLRLNSQSSCDCHGGRSYFNPALEVIERECTVYCLGDYTTCRIELQSCPKCPKGHRRYIGADLREMGLFNYNNRVLVSHQLLEEYTHNFTSHEAPITTYVLGVVRRYDESGFKFMSEKLFRSAWFAYASLYSFGDDMQCSICGTDPEDLIWDGVTLAFGKKHLSGTLAPPTVLHEESLVRKTVYVPKQQFILEAGLRKEMKKALDPPSTRGEVVEEEEEEGSRVEATTARAERKKEAAARAAEVAKRVAAAKKLSYIETLQVVSAGVGKLQGGEGLWTLFTQTHGYAAWSTGKKSPPAFRKLLQQVSGAYHKCD